MSAILDAYIDCALWSSSIEPDDTSMESAGYTRDDIAPSALASMETDVVDFLTGVSLQSALDFWAYEHGEAAIGHDFWLTRNGHGAGFWDRWSGDTAGTMFGRILTDDAKPYGESYLYIGDDGLVYVS